MKSDLFSSMSSEKNSNEAAIKVLFVSQLTQSGADTKCEMHEMGLLFFLSLVASWLADKSAAKHKWNEMKQTKQLQSTWTKLIETKH